MTLALTDDQQAGYAAVVDLVTTDKKCLIINGYAGTGKTTLVKTFLDEWPQICALSAGAFKDMPVYLTATTNKAADALSSSTGREATTIHSFLGLRVISKGWRETDIIETGKALPPAGIVVIDEASFIDDKLLSFINIKLKDGFKAIFLGDPYQLKPVGSDDTPVFNQGIPSVELKQIVRQTADSPIQKLSMALRDHVAGSPLPIAGVDGVNILHMDKPSFEAAFVNDCVNNRGISVRALAWTNQRAINLNELVTTFMRGDAEITAGDTVVVNKQVKLKSGYKLQTDSTVYVIEAGNWFKDHNDITCRKLVTQFGEIYQAKDPTEVIPLIKQAYARQNEQQAWILENRYVDVRHMYASTVNKSQGSTYDIVYIDLGDIGACRDADQVRRMLYVAVSRARHKVVFTGDI